MDHEEATGWREAANYCASRLASLVNLADHECDHDHYRLSSAQRALIDQALKQFTVYTGEPAPTGAVFA